MVARVTKRSAVASIGRVVRRRGGSLGDESFVLVAIEEMQRVERGLWPVPVEDPYWRVRLRQAAAYPREAAG